MHSAAISTCQAESVATAPGDYPRCTLGFALFLVLNATLFIRPAEIFQSLEGLPIYNVVIVGCLLAALPVLISQMSWTHLRANPAIFCVVGLLPAIVLSQLVRGNTWMAREGATEFGKVLLYFMLLVGLVNTPRRLGTFVLWTVAFIVTIAAIAELNYHGVINVKGISIAERSMGINEVTGEGMTVEQLYGPGIFNDPNDFSLILSAGILILLHIAIQTRRWLIRGIVLAAVVVPGYAFAMTRSRGGFLAFTAGLVVLAYGRFGWKRSIPIMMLVLPVMLLAFGERMTNIDFDSQDDTAQGRMMLWRDGFAALKTSPIFGIGYAGYAEEVGHVAHNSFVHASTELGLLGGVLFTAIWYVPISILLTKPAVLKTPALRELAFWRQGLLTVLVGYATGLSSLSRVYTVSTYLVLGLGVAYATLLGQRSNGTVPELTSRYARRLLVVGICCLVVFNVLVRVAL